MWVGGVWNCERGGGGGDGGDRLKLLSPGQGDQALGSSPGPHTFNRGAEYVKGAGGGVGCG
jgi:hypothetical protein